MLRRSWRGVLAYAPLFSDMRHGCVGFRRYPSSRQQLAMFESSVRVAALSSCAYGLRPNLVIVRRIWIGCRRIAAYVLLNRFSIFSFPSLANKALGLLLFKLSLLSSLRSSSFVRRRPAINADLFFCPGDAGLVSIGHLLPVLAPIKRLRVDGQRHKQANSQADATQKHRGVTAARNVPRAFQCVEVRHK